MNETQITTMGNTITVNNYDMPIKEYNNVRVVTFKDIDMVHQRPNGTAGRNFRKNKEHFIENEDYYIITQPDEIRRLGFIRPQGGTSESIILVTESGYLMLVKSFTDDLAWQVQRKLVNTYFKAKDMMFIMFNMIKGLEEKSEMRYNALSSKIDKTIPSQPNYFLWKKTIANPLVESISKILDLPIADTYKVIYDDMTSHGFNQPFAMDRFCHKYLVDNVSTIDSIADVDNYVNMFMESCNRLLSVANKENIIDDNISSDSKVDNNITSENINYSTMTVEEIIQPLVNLYNDTSVNNAYTYKRVYKVMRSDRSWKALMTRRHCKYKKALVSKFADIKRDFSKAVNQLMEVSAV